MDALLVPEIIRRLETDPALDFKISNGQKLSKGRCPECNKQEAYVFKDAPFVIHCPRGNECGEKTSVRRLYKDMFTNYSEKYPPTETDPNQTARMYMRYQRGFDASIVDGLYTQGQKPIYKNEKVFKYAQCVEFKLWGRFVWQRLIDQEDIRLNDNNKNYITKGCEFKNKGWVPPGQQIKSNTWVFITEGILKSLALMHMKVSFDIATIAAISSSNLPRNIINEHQGQGVVWVLAFDNDAAGIKASKKFKKEIESLGETVLVALPPGGYDWDDVLKEQRDNESTQQKEEHKKFLKLNEQLIKDSLYRGALLTAESYKEKLFWLFTKSQVMPTFRYSFGHSLWRAKLDERRARENALSDWPLNECWANPHEDLDDMQKAVVSSFNFERISNCEPIFLYLEKDAITDDQFYFFKIKYASGNPETMLGFEGAALQSASGFSSYLLNKSSGGSFDGNAYDLKNMREHWFDKRMNEVRALPFVGYDKVTGGYVFPFGGYFKNRFIKLNEHGFIAADKHQVKTSLKSMVMVPSQEFNGDWFKDFLTCFSTNGLAALAWWFGCLFAEQIRDKQNSWCFFELTGDQGAGKSTLLEFLWKLLGRINYEGFDPNKATSAGRARNFIQPSNMPVVLIEGDRNTDEKGAKKGGFDLDELKTTYNGRGFRALGVAKRGADTEELPFRGGIVFSQNATVDGSEALLARIVHFHCDRSHHSTESETAIKRLNVLEAKSLAGFLHKVLTQTDKIFEAYLKNFDLALAEFSKELPSVQNRLVLNHAQVYAWGLCLPMIFGKHITKDNLAQLKAHLIARANDRQQRLKADHPMVAKFWDIYDSENDSPERVESFSQPTALLNHSKNQERIAIHLVDFEKKISAKKLDKGLDFTLLKRLLPGSQRYAFDAQKVVVSDIDGKRRHCWVFMREKQVSS